MGAGGESGLCGGRRVLLQEAGTCPRARREPHLPLPPGSAVLAPSRESWRTARGKARE